MPAPEPSVRREVDGRVGRITIDRPAKLNALSRAVLEELAAAARWFDDQAEVSVVVVGGAGRAFSAGFDLADRTWGELGPTGSAEVGRAMADAVGGMRALTIAAVQGHCVGGGVVLAAACDLRVAADDARFRIPEVDLGIPLFWSGVPRLVRELGPAMTKELVLTGRPFDAAEANALRFVNRVVPVADLDAAVGALAAELAAKPALVLRTTKLQVDDAVPPVPPADGLALTTELEGYAAALADPESRDAAARYVQAKGKG
ncbi:MAG TPA: enoyl-CoA hydratase/isomerase family protein [Acidimicrobiales bacterium]|nr:enoyl-CoA hydratase/isomerase family protein [Acidimicrobiales bacterium]